MGSEREREDLELLLSLQNHSDNEVLETPPSSPSPGYVSDEDDLPGSRKPLGMDAFRDFYNDTLPDDDDKNKAGTGTGTGTGTAAAPKPSKPSLSNNGIEIENYSGLRIRNRLVSTHNIGIRFSNLRFIRLQAIRNAMAVESIKGSWATVGVLAEKGATKVSSNGKNYAVWKLGSLDKTTVSLFLFGNAYNNHWKEMPGSILSIFNANVRRDGKGNEFSLSVFATDQVVKLGTSADFGTCKAKRKDGTPCTSIINKNQGSYCQFHANTTQKKYITKRTELGGGNLQSAFRKLPRQEGIFVAKPLSEISKNSKANRPVRIMSTNALQDALSKAKEVITKHQSQGIRFLSKVANAENVDPKSDAKESEKLRLYKDYLKKRSFDVARSTDAKLHPEVEAKKKRSERKDDDVMQLDIVDE